MKKVLLCVIMLLVTACSDPVNFEAIEIGNKVCEPNKGLLKIYTGFSLRTHHVRCKNGAEFFLRDNEVPYDYTK